MIGDTGLMSQPMNPGRPEILKPNWTEFSVSSVKKFGLIQYVFFLKIDFRLDLATDYSGFLLIITKPY